MLLHLLLPNRKGFYISGLFVVRTAMQLHYSPNLENLVATQMTLLLCFFTMLRQFLRDSGAADVTVYWQGVLFSSRVWTLRSYRIFWLRTLKRVYHFLHDIGQSVLDSYGRDTTPFSPRNWRFRSYRVFLRTLRTFRILTAPSTSCFFLQH